jgi:hypothetical protein
MIMPTTKEITTSFIAVRPGVSPKTGLLYQTSLRFLFIVVVGEVII